MGALPTCTRTVVAAPLERWHCVPTNTKTFALIVDDPDAPDPETPQRIYVHWAVYNLPATATALPENALRRD